MNTKEKIFEAALRLFSEKGFNATSVREITRDAGITPGSLYNHFAGKDELLQAVYDYYTELFIQPQMPEYERLLRQHGVAGLFRYLTESYIGAMRNEKLSRLTKIILMEQYTNPIAGEIAYRDRQRLLSFMEELFVQMSRLGYIQTEDPKHAGRLLGYVYLGFSADNFYHFYLDKQSPEEIAAQQIETILRYVSGMLKTPSV